jgi:hypothetical protein
MIVLLLCANQRDQIKTFRGALKRVSMPQVTLASSLWFFCQTVAEAQQLASFAP